MEVQVVEEVAVYWEANISENNNSVTRTFISAGAPYIHLPMSLEQWMVLD